MGGKGSKSPSESENTPDSLLSSDIIQGTPQSSLKPVVDSSVAKTLEIKSSIEASTVPESQHLDIESQFKVFIEACTTDTNQSKEAITNQLQIHISDGLTTLSMKKLTKCFFHLVSSLYTNFDKLIIYKNIIFVVSEDKRQSSRFVIDFSTSFGRISRLEIKKILSNKGWNEIVMFGALLCELAVGNHEKSEIFIKELNFWVNELIKSALGGNENGLIAYMLILYRMIKHKAAFEQINRGYFKILLTLLGDDDKKSKLQIIESCLKSSNPNDKCPITFDSTNSSEQKKLFRIPKNVKVIDSDFLEEVVSSQKCRDFDRYLNSKSKGVNDYCDFFSDATNNEIEYFAKRFVEFGIENPKEIKMLGSIGSKYQNALLRIRKLIKELIKSIEGEFEALKQAGKGDSIKIGNLGKLLGELYVSERQIFPPELMTSYLTFLMDNGDITAIASTLKLCGYFYMSKYPKHYENFIESIAVFRKIVEDESTYLSENFENKEEIYKARLFKADESARKIGSLEVMLTSITDNKSVRYNYELIEILHMNHKRLIKMVINSLHKPDANVIEIAKFLKSLNDFTYKIGNFVKRLKVNLEVKVLDMTDDDLHEMRFLGKLIAELKNLSVTSNESQKLWLEKAKSLDNVGNFKVMEVYVDVVKAMLVNIQVHEFDRLQEILGYLMDIHNSPESSYSEIEVKIKSKVAQILQNLVNKKIEPATTDLLFKIRLGHKVDGLPKDMPESDPNVVNVHDFAKIFYVNAVSNHLFTVNFTNSIRHLKYGSKGATFIQCLRDTMSDNLFPSIFSPDFCESDEAHGTFEFVVKLFKEEVLTEKEIISFLQIIFELKDLEKYKECASKFVENLEIVIITGSKRNAKKFSQTIRKCVERVRKKLKEVDIKNKDEEQVEERNVEVNKDKEVENSKISSEKVEKLKVDSNDGQCVEQKLEESNNSKENSQEGPIEAFCSMKVHELSFIGKLDTPVLELLPLKESILLEPSKSHNTTNISNQSSLGDPQCLPTNTLEQPGQSSWQQMCELLKKDQEKDSCLSTILMNQENPLFVLEIEGNLSNDDHLEKHVEDYGKLQLEDDSASLEGPKNLTSINNSSQESNLSLQTQLQASNPSQSITNINKESSQSFPSIHSPNLNIPGLSESYNEILPIITANTSQLKRHAISIYSWGIEDPNFKPQVKKLVDLLSTELRKHHKQLLSDVSKELIDECDKIRRKQGARKHSGKEFSQQRDSFILTFRAVAPFLEKRQLYDNLHWMLVYINDGNRLALDLFLDIIEEMEEIFSVDCKARKSFVTFCVNTLEYARHFKNASQTVTQKTSKMLKYFKTLQAKSERSQSTESFNIQTPSPSLMNENYVSPWPDKQRRGRRGRQRSRDSSQSTQKSGMSGMSSQSNRKSSKDIISSGKSILVFQSSAKTIQGHSSQSTQVSEMSSQNTHTSGKSSQHAQVSEKSSSNPSNVIRDPPASMKTDAKVMYYINQLQLSNFKQLASKINPILAKDFSKVRFMEILLQKAISDEMFIKPAIDLFAYLFDNNGLKTAKLTMADEIGNEFINLCEDGGKLEQKMLNLAKFTLEFDPYLKGSFLVELWSQLLEFVEQDCPNSLKVLLLLMADNFKILHESRERKKFFRYIIMVFKRKLAMEKNKNLRARMNKIIKSFEEEEAQNQATSQSRSSSQSKTAQPVAKPPVKIAQSSKTDTSIISDRNCLRQAVKASIPSENLQTKSQEIDKNHAKVIEGLTKNLNSFNIARVSPVSLPAVTSKPHQLVVLPTASVELVQAVRVTQPQFNQNFIKIHPDDIIRPLDFTPDYFLFDNLITNQQKFERILKNICEKCNSLEVTEQNSITVKEFIAVAIIEINFLKTQAKPEEIDEFAKTFYEIYTRTDQTKTKQWILMKFLKAWRLHDHTSGNNSKKQEEKLIKIYDRFSKSVLRVKKSFKISGFVASKIDAKVKSSNETISENITSKLNDLTPKSDSVTQKSDFITSKNKNIIDKTEGDINSMMLNDTSSYGDLTTKSKSSTSKSGDMTLKSENVQTQPSTIQKPDDITSNLEVLTAKSKNVTSKAKTITLVFDDLVPKSSKSSNFNTQNKFNDLNLKSEDGTLKSGKITSKTSDIGLQIENMTSKSDNLPSKSGDLTSKSSNQPSTSISTKFFMSFMTSLQNKIFNHFTDTTFDLDRDPMLDYFKLEKKKAYEIVCDLYFQDVISTQFIVICVTKMFEYPFIIDKNIDVVVRLMKLVDKMVRIRNKDKNCLEFLKPFWLRLPFGVELMFAVSVDKWTKLKNFLQKALLYKLNSVEFRAIIENFWSELMENPEKFFDVVQVFEDFLEVLEDSFAVLIVDFLENRRISLERFPPHNISKAVSQKYKTSILFTFELFEMGILSSDGFLKWLDSNIFGKLVQEHNFEILLEFGQRGLKIDGNLNENLKIYIKKLNNMN